AYLTVQDALADAACTEIWVAKGVYYPDEGAGQTDGYDFSTFTLNNNIALYGGFAGTETALSERDVAANVTVLSGDIDQNDTTDANGVVTDTANIVGPNAYHVVTGGAGNTATLDGFTITAGQASDSLSSGYGGGMTSGPYNGDSNPTLNNIIFSGNSASQKGGGMYSTSRALTLTNVVFSNNSVNSYGGGGLLVDSYVDSNGKSLAGATLINVTFSGNSSLIYGGGMMVNSGDAITLTNVTFSDNSANYGGGLANFSSPSAATSTLNNVTFTGNSATSWGGGMESHGNTVLSNVTFNGNSSGGGGGLRHSDGSAALTDVIFLNNSVSGSGGGMYVFSGDATLSNVTFSGNSATGSGGGFVGSNTTFTNVTFLNNAASNGGGFAGYQSTLTNVTFSGNSASGSGGSGDGGGVQSTGVITITNATFSGNSATNNGGGMENWDNSILTNVTFSGNSANQGGGFYNSVSNKHPLLTNVIIADSVSGGDCVIGVSASLDSASSNNLIEDAVNACDLTDGVNNNVIGQDPMLGSLTDYGGIGQMVFPLVYNSPAINAGDNSRCPTTDQTGASRPHGNVCDIGAYEWGYNYRLSIDKLVDDLNPVPGQTITTSIIVANTELTVTNVTISDLLPSGLNFVGPITLDDPSGTGTLGAAPPVLASGINMSPGAVVTVTFPVTVSNGQAVGTAITNTATVTATEVTTS
ncbi:MAG: hypothetical protein D6706_16115, partial [Chloroflexi bacterium]